MPFTAALTRSHWLSRIMTVICGVLWVSLCYLRTEARLHDSEDAYLADLQDKTATQARRAADRLEAAFHSMTDLATAFAEQPAVLALLQRHQATAEALAARPIEERKAVLFADPEGATIDDYFRRVASETHYDLIFLLDQAGTCIAINNAGEPNSGIGVSYANRQYFRGAMATGSGQEFAVGRLTPVPAFFFASAVRVNGKVVGAAAVRRTAESLAVLMETGAATTLVVDEQGMVVAAGQPEHLLRHIGLWDQGHGLDPKPQALGDLALAAGPGDRPGSQILWDGRAMVAAGQPVDGSPYRLWVLAPPADRGEVNRALVETGVLAGGVGLLVLLVLDRIVAHLQTRRLHAAALTAANQALITANQQLYAMATVDSLTGAANRRHFFERAAESLSLAERSHQPRTMIILDLDHFKQINDTHGHPAGDDVLAATARTCMGLTRISDAFGRIGGEEFALLLADTGMAGALVLAERLRAAIAAMEIPHRLSPLRVTASLGLAELRSGETCETLYNRADVALYAAKTGGRDRVIAATS